MSEEPPVPSIEIPRSFTADGGDPFGQEARFCLVDVGGRSLARPTTSVGLAWDTGALRVLFAAEAEPPLRVAAPGAATPVFEDECVELFLAGGEDPSEYLEVVVNPAGAVYGARVRNPDGSRATWRLTPGVPLAGLSVAVRGEPSGAPPADFHRWSCALGLPWGLLSSSGRPPGEGEIRRGNAFRIARGRTTSFAALSPTLRDAPPDFHVPARFARLVFRVR